MALLYYSKLTPSSISAPVGVTTGYDAENVGNERILKQYRSDDTVGIHRIEIDLGSDKAVAGIAVQHCNLNLIVVYTGDTADGSAANYVGNLEPEFEGNSRNKGVFYANDTIRYINLSLDVTYLTDSSSYFYVGAVYVYGGRVTLPNTITYGWTKRYVYPTATTTLTNGRTETATAGVSFCALTFRHEEEISDVYPADAARLMRFARNATAWLHMDDTDRPGNQWPVRHVARSETWTKQPAFSPFTTSLVEVV